MNDITAILDEVFGAEEVTPDQTGCLRAIADLLSFCRPSLLLLADRHGKVLAADDLGSGAGLEAARALARQAAAASSAEEAQVLESGDGRRPRAALAIPFGGDGEGGILAGLIQPDDDMRRRLKTMQAVLRVCAQTARSAIQTELDARTLRTRLRHLLTEQETLKSAHTEATSRAVEEQAKRLSEEQERQAMEELCTATEAANRAKSQFLANMSHEIRTPLNAILGFTEILLKEDPNTTEAERRDYLETISSSGRHLLDLINDILDLSKIEAGRIQLEKVRCSPHAIIAGVISVLRVRAGEKGLLLQAEWPDGVPASIETDPTRLHQLLINLVGNALKFTESGSVRIVTRLPRSGAGRQMVFEVVDTGIGIAPDKLHTIFDAFVQADNSVTRRFGGTGLGLAISRKIATALGGDLTVRSQLGAGSTFMAAIDPGPLEGVEIFGTPPSDGVAPKDSDAVQRQVTLPPARILLVEDGSTNRKLITLLLKRAGAQVTSAENGQIGVELASQGSFDLILMDMQMPVLDGYSATRILRDRRIRVPIIALTAHAMTGDEQKCLRAGCSGYLSKPVNSERLLQTIAACLASAGGPARTGEGAPGAEELSATEAQVPDCTSPPADPLVSSLPTDDTDFREIVVDFVQSFEQDLERLKQAWAQRDLQALARIAHGLKGAGGSAGFDVVTEAAKRLEALAKQRRTDQLQASLDQLRALAARIVVPEAPP